jgi:aminotransferase
MQSLRRSIGSLPGMEDRTITAISFSKAYAMTGWMIGYVVAEKKLSATLRKLHYYAVLCPNAISQKAALAALTGSQDCVKEMVTDAMSSSFFIVRSKVLSLCS